MTGLAIRRTTVLLALSSLLVTAHSTRLPVEALSLESAHSAASAGMLAPGSLLEESAVADDTIGQVPQTRPLPVRTQPPENSEVASELYVPSAILVDQLDSEHPLVNLNLAFPARDPAMVAGQDDALLRQLQEMQPAFAQSAAAPAPEIEALAAGLAHDPRTIFEYVRNGFDFTPTWGLLKGPHVTVLAKAGNALDQAALLGALLQASGFETRYVRGVVDIPISQAMNWVGVSNAQVLPYVFWNGGVGAAVSGDVLRINHVWVLVKIDGAWYPMDPSFKTYRPVNGVNMAGVIGYSQSAFLTAALSGSTVTDRYVQRINRTNIRDRLGQHSNELLNYLRVNLPFATLDEVTGGRSIVYQALTSYPTQLPYTVEPGAIETAVLPPTWMYRLHVELPGIDYWANLPDIAGERLTVFYVAASAADQGLLDAAGGVYRVDPAYQVNVKPQLRVGGSVVGTGSAASLGDSQPITVTIVTPILDGQGNPWVVSYAPQRLRAGASYALPLSLEGVSVAELQRHLRILEENRNAGLADTSESVLGESLYLIGLSYYNQADISQRLSARMAGMVLVPHISGMIMSQDLAVLEWQLVGGTPKAKRLGVAAFTIDIRLNWLDALSASGNADRERGFMTEVGHKNSSIEQATLEQLQGTPSVSTIRILDIANSQGLRIYKIVSTTVETILPLLDYPARTKDALRADAMAGYEVTVPERNISYNQWTGTGWISFAPQSGSSGYWISGGLGTVHEESWLVHNGGSGTTPGTIDSGDLQQQLANGTAAGTGCSECNNPSPDAPNNVGADPVDAATGAFVHGAVDVSFGSLGHSISFARTYVSDQRNYTGTLGNGWIHAYELRATQTSDWARAFGFRSAIDAVAAIVAAHISMDLATNPPGGLTLTELVVGSEGTDWLLSRVTKNAVNVAGLDGTKEYLMLSDGTYRPVQSMSSRLLRNSDGTYTEETKDGSRLTFDAQGRGTSIVDSNGNRTSLTYDSMGRLVRVTDAAGRNLNLSYASGRLTQITDPAGRIFRYEYDVSGNLVRHVDARGGITTYTYDNKHRLLTIRDAGGITFTTNVYDNWSRVTRQTDGLGGVMALRYGDVRSTVTDPLGGQTVFYWDAYRRMTGRVDALGNAVTQAYDVVGNILWWRDARGNRTNFAYDNRGNLIRTTDPLGYSTYLSHDGQDNLVQVTNALSGTIRLSYDSRRNPLRVTDALNNTTARTYDSRGLITAIQDANGHSTTASYDAYGNLTRLADPLGHAATMNYDVLGRMTRLSDPNGHTVQLAYDAADNVVTETSALGGVSEFGYDANSLLISSTDALGRTTRMGYDGHFNLVCVTDTMGNVTRYVYDVNSQLVAITDANAHTTQLQRDALGRITRSLDPLGRATQFTYDGAGNMLTKTKADGNVLGYQYDAGGRVTRISYPDGSSLLYQYDAIGNITVMTQGVWQARLAYDAVGRLIRRELPGDNIILSITYDLIGNLMSLRADRIGTLLYNVQYSYDAADRLTSATDRISAQTVNYGYDNGNNPTTISYPGGSRTTYTYDASHRTVRVQNSDRNSGNMSTWTYRYDAIDNPVQITSTVGSVSLGTTLVYDQLDRLVRESYPRYSVDYAYDAVGNRVRLTNPAEVVTYTYDAADQLLRAGAAVFSYDANGNQVVKTDARGSFRFDYDYENRLRRIVAPGDRISTFQYDATGRRVGTSGSAGERRFIFFGMMPILGESTGLADGVAYLYGNGLLSASRPITGSDALPLSYHGDALGNVVNLSDASGLSRGAYNYDPFGRVVVKAGARRDTRGFVGQLGVQAEEAASDLYLMGLRYYDASTGRFITTDPLPGFLERPQTLQRYDYALDNPLRYTDPLGLRASAQGSASAATSYEAQFAQRNPWWAEEHKRQAAMTWWDHVKDFHRTSAELLRGMGLINSPSQMGPGSQVKTPWAFTGGTDSYPLPVPPDGIKIPPGLTPAERERYIYQFSW